MSVRVLQVMALAAFFCASAAHGGVLNKSTLSGLPYSSTGKTVTMGEGALTAAGAAGRAPSGTGQIGQSGFYYGTGAQMNPASGQTMTMGMNGEVFIAGTKYPFQAGHQVPARDIGLAALGLIGGWPGLAITGALIAAPHIKDWLDGAGARPRADGKGWEQKEDLGGCEKNCYYWKNHFNRTSGSPADLCNDYIGGANPDFATVSVSARILQGGDVAWCNGTLKNGGWSGSWQLERVGSRTPDNIVYLPKSMDDIAPYLLRSMFSPEMVKDIINNGGAIPLGTPTVTGPSQIVGEPKTSSSTGTQVVNGETVPTKTTTTEQTTYNFTTNNNQITNTTNNTTTTTVTVNQSTGAVIGQSTTTTETKPKETDERTECEKNPKQLNCSDLDTPDGEIPRKQIDVTWSPVDLGLGGGSCPSPVQIYENKQFSYQLACDNLMIIKPMVIAIALFIAGMIVFGGRPD